MITIVKRVACLTALLVAACGPGSVMDRPGATNETDDQMPVVDRPPPPPPPSPDVDADGDGLDDEWEIWAGDMLRLDPTKIDTDGNGINDADEDFDGDGLTNRQELALARLSPEPAGMPPHPFERTLLVELDAMQNRHVDSEVLERAAEAYREVGIGITFFRDQTDIGVVRFDGTFEQRFAQMRRNGPRFEGLSLEDIPVDRMVHVFVAAERTDIQGRGGEVVTDVDGGNVENTGLFLYYDTLDGIHPACTVHDGGPITLEDALAGTLVHELGHALQLGHDTDRGGGVNQFNIMSVASSCVEALMRLRGIGNDDTSLGATEAVAQPRFSQEAARLIELDRVVSVDTATLIGDTGRDM